MLCAWLSSGLDSGRLTAKMGRMLGQLTGREGKGIMARKGSNTAVKKLLKAGGVRGVFEAIDKDAEGTVSQRDMKVYIYILAQSLCFYVE